MSDLEARLAALKAAAEEESPSEPKKSPKESPRASPSSPKKSTTSFGDLEARFAELQAEAPKIAPKKSPRKYPKKSPRESPKKSVKSSKAEPEPAPEPSPELQKIDLPHGWEEMKSRSTGKTFYSHAKSGETTWTKPTEEKEPLHDYKALVLNGKIFPCSPNILKGSAKVEFKKTESARNKEISVKTKACSRCPTLENLGLLPTGELVGFEFFPRQVGYGDIPGEVLFVPKGCIFYKGIQKPLLQKKMKRTKDILDKLSQKMIKELPGWYASKSVAKEYAEYGVVCFKINRPIILMNILDIRNVNYLNQLIKRNKIASGAESNLQKATKSKKKMIIAEIKGLDEAGKIRNLNPTEVIHCGKHLGNCEKCIHRLSGDYDIVFPELMEYTPTYCDGYFGDTTITSPDRLFYHEAYFKDATVNNVLQFVSPADINNTLHRKKPTKKPKKSKRPKKSKKPKKK